MKHVPLKQLLRLLGKTQLDTAGMDPAALEEEMRSRMFRFGTFALLACVLVYVGIHAWGSRPRALVADLVLLAVIIVIWAYGTTTRRFLLAQNVMHTALFLIVLYQGYLSGIVYRGAIWWLSILPFVTMVAGARGLAIVQLSVFLALSLWFGIQPPNIPPEPVPHAVQLHTAVATVLSSLYCFAYMLQGLRWRDELERALAEARATALEAASMKARFLATMSHEIRTPLNGVVGSAELLQKTNLGESERAQMLSLLMQSSKALLALINDILDWSKLDVGKISIERRPINLRALMFESNELFAGQAANKGIELTSSCDPDVPRMLEGDPTRIRQIINNLVSNAVKFTAQGGVHLHLSFDGIDPSDETTAGAPRIARIEVSDSGIGMAAHKVGVLFQAFVQGDASVSHQYGGTGLGLAISQELARLMGGRIEVSSTLGVGSTFTLMLPMRVLGPMVAKNVPRPCAEVILATASPGLRRHLRSILCDLHVEPTTLGGLPSDAELRACKLLIVDALLLAGVDNLVTWLDRQAAFGRRVAVITPLNRDAVLGAMPEAMLLYKPVRLSSMRPLLEAATIIQPEPAVATGDEAPIPESVLHGLRVLIAEDNQVNQVVFKAMLAQGGAECSIACNGQEALDALAGDTFDIVLMDVQMPVLDGLSAVRRLRDREASAPDLDRTTVVAMTANTEPQDITACRAAGMDDFLPKPFGLGQLIGVLSRHALRTSPSCQGA